MFVELLKKFNADDDDAAGINSSDTFNDDVDSFRVVVVDDDVTEEFED